MEVRIKKIIIILDAVYPHPRPSLNFNTPFESLVATILSAQCTDKRVNLVTKVLFKMANTPRKTLDLGEKKLSVIIMPTGFYKAKTKSVIGASKKIIQDFNGIVPDNLEDLQKLPGVGRKTASVVLAQAFNIPAFPVDRHIFRVANRLALTKSKTPDETDIQLRKSIPESLWIRLHLQLIYHGREICRPKPKCSICPLLRYCPDGQKRIKNGDYQK